MDLHSGRQPWRLRGALAGALLLVPDLLLAGSPPTTGRSMLDAPAPAAAPPPAAGVPKVDFKGRVNDRTEIGNGEEAKAYCQALIAAFTTPAEAFARAARRDVTFAHVFEETDKYRGNVIHIEGWLKRLRRFDPPEFVKTYDVADLYEGWVFNPEVYGANYKWCILFPVLPAGLEVGEKLDRAISFDGYLFKLYRYRAGDGLRDAPLLIGRAPELKASAPAAEDDGSFSRTLLGGLVAVVAGSVALTIGLGWWYRRGDRHVRSRTAATQAGGFVEPAPAPETADDWQGGSGAS